MNDNNKPRKLDPNDNLKDIYYAWNIYHVSLREGTDGKPLTLTVAPVQIGMDISRSEALCRTHSYEEFPEWMQEKISMLQVLSDEGKNVVGVGIQLSPTDFWVYEHEGDREG